MTRLVRIASCQISLIPDAKVNLKKCLNLIDQAGQSRPHLIVLPEMSNWSGGLVKTLDDALLHGITLESDFIKDISTKAHQYQAFIAVGFIEKVDQEAFITSVIISPQQSIVLKYQKQILFAGQINWASPGRCGNPVVELPFGKVGVYICADGLVPETARILTLKGAKLLINTLHSGGHDETLLHVPARAIENKVWLVSSNKSGMRDLGATDRFSGGSQIVSPTGKIIARANHLDDTVITAEIDLNEADGILHRGEHLTALRQPKYYSQLINHNYVLTQNSSAHHHHTVGLATACPTGSSDQKLQSLDQIILNCHLKGAKLIVLPSLCMHSSDLLPSDLTNHANIDSIALLKLQQLSKIYSSWIVFNGIEYHSNSNSFSISNYLISASGSICGQYKQVHLTTSESNKVERGKKFPVFDTPIGKVGLLSGADAWLPESFRILSYQGANIITVSGSWEDENDIDILIKERVAENRVNIVFSNREDSKCLRGSIICSSTPYPSEPHWKVRFPDIVESKLTQNHLVSTVDVSATNDKTVSPFGCNLMLSPLHHEYSLLTDTDS